MNKKWVRITVISMSSIIMLLIVANFGLNYWLQNNLPDYIKKNTEYSIVYRDIDVDLGTGNILTTHISISNKNEKNDSILRLKGTIDSLEISRFGIFDALFNKKISFSSLKMVQPNLVITLPNPDKKKNKKKKEASIPFKNLEIIKGNIAIFKSNNDQLFSANNLSVNIKKLELAAKGSDQLLPISFDQQFINGDHFYFRQGDLQIVKAAKIHTENDLINIKNLEITPLLSYAQFATYYPEKGSFVKGTIGDINFKDFVLKKKSIDLKDFTIDHANLQLYTFNKKIKTKKPFQFKVGVDNIQVKNSKFQVFNGAENRVFAGGNLNLTISDLEMDEETLKSKIPIKYKSFSANGTDVESVFGQQKMVFSQMTINPNSVQLNDIKLQKIGDNGKKTNMDGNIKQVAININDWKFDEDNLDIDLKNILVDGANGNLNLAKSTQKKKPITGIEFPLLLEKLELKNSNLAINSNGKRVFSGKNLQVSVDKIAITEKSSRSKIPFEYKDFKATGNSIVLTTENQNIAMQSAVLIPKSIQLNNLQLKPTGNFSSETAMDGFVKNVSVKIKEWNFNNDLLKLNIDEVLINGVNGKLNLAQNKNTKTKKQPITGINFPLTIKKISLQNSNLDLYTNKNPMTFKNLNANISNIEMNAQTIKNKTPVKIGSYNLVADNFNYKLGDFYNSSIGKINIDNNKISLTNFIVKPTVSRAEFVRRQKVEKDLYDIKFKQLTATGKWDLFSDQMSFYVNNVNIDDMNALIFRSKVPPDDLTVKLLYSSMLANVKFPLFIEDFNIKNSRLIYEEDTKKSDGPGKIIFGDFNLNVKNINSGKFAGKPTNVLITIKTMMMDSAPLTVNWEFDTAKKDDYFTVSGYTGDLPAPDLNLFTEPYLKVRATGEISRLAFAFNGDTKTISGTFKMLHKNLKVQMLNEDGDKKVIISALANLFVKNDSGPNPPAILIENVERDNTKSFFNFLWRGLEAGLKKTLVGIGSSAKKVETTEEFPSNTAEISALKEIEQKRVEKKNKKGFLRRIFKKKEKAEN